MKSAVLKGLLIVATLLICTAVVAKPKPKWLTGDLPVALNSTYTFVKVTSKSSDLEMARQMCLSKLAQDQQLLRTLQVQSTTSMTTTTHQDITAKGIDERTGRDMVVNVTLNGRPFALKAQIVDEYYTLINEGGRRQYEVSVLYMVGYDANAVFDEFYVTTKYGAQGFVRSLIPGWGQFYKGQNVRGSIIVGAQVLTIAGVIYSQSMKSSYLKFMAEDPAHAVEYSRLADTWTNVGYGFIAAAAGVYLYNLIDAAVAPGAARVVLSERAYFSMAPVVTPDYAGVGLVCNF